LVLLDHDDFLVVLYCLVLLLFLLLCVLLLCVLLLLYLVYDFQYQLHLVQFDGGHFPAVPLFDNKPSWIELLNSHTERDMESQAAERYEWGDQLVKAVRAGKALRLLDC
jgi:hypothetical protein